MKNIIIFIALFCLISTFETDNKQFYSEIDCTDSGSIQVISGERYGCNDKSTQVRKSEFFNAAQCSDDYGNSWYDAIKCSDSEDVDVDWCYQSDGNQFTYNGQTYGCPLDTFSVEVYQSQSGKNVVICGDDILAVKCSNH